VRVTAVACRIARGAGATVAGPGRGSASNQDCAAARSQLAGFARDADLIAQALTNLLANAIKYSPIQTEITIAGYADENDLIVDVIDRGYGIPATSLTRIFEKFYAYLASRMLTFPVPDLGWHLCARSSNSMVVEYLSRASLALVQPSRSACRWPQRELVCNASKASRPFY